MIQRYGGECACCGETEPAFLQIDHVEGGGTVHRQRIHSSDALIRLILESGCPPGYQVLCANCNMAKEQQGGCPHQQGGSD